MATAEPPVRPHDRHSRRRPFSSWMRRLANLKSSSSESPNSSGKKSHVPTLSKSKKTLAGKNNPYPQSAYLNKPAPAINAPGHLSFSTPVSQSNPSYTSFEEDGGGHNAPMRSNRSAAPTLATNAETIHSDAGHSKAGTSNTAGAGENSTFSSPNHSARSLTTTLTTIQSAAPSGLLSTQQQQHSSNAPQSSSSTHHNHQNPQPHQQPVHFTHQYPISPAPASAIPAHLAPQPNPHTYSAATANGMLTDNASILTLASSSKRRRRHSLDTDASVRALAPSSLFGNSRESLPLSVLSGNVDIGGPSTAATGPAGIYQSQNRPSIGGLASAERASVYSFSTSTAPGAGGIPGAALSSERNSYYAAKQIGLSGNDGGSVRSGLAGHGRNDSITHSVAGGAAGAQSSPLAASPREAGWSGRGSRRGSDWWEGRGDADADSEEEDEGRRV